METVTEDLDNFLTGIAEKKAYPTGFELNLYYNRLGAKEIKALAMALQSGQCPQRLQLKLNNKELDAEAVKPLAMALQSGQSPPGLQLKLYDNEIGNEGAKALAMALQSGQCPPGLQLDLGINELDAEAVKPLAMALQSGQCPPMLQVNLGNNPLIGDEGAKALAMALQSGQCPPGLQLDLYDNSISAEGAKALAMALQSGQCPQGLQLKLYDNQIGNEGAKALAMALQSGQCPPGLQLDLENNLISLEAEQIFKTAWAVYEAKQQDNFINCVTLYQGYSQVNSSSNRLPLEIVQEIHSHILPAAPILAKMTEISTKAFRTRLAMLKLANTSEPVQQLDNALSVALSAKKLTEKATQIKTAINNFLHQELASLEPKASVQWSTVALLSKYHLLAGNKVDLLASLQHQPDEPEGQPPLKKMRL